MKRKSSNRLVSSKDSEEASEALQRVKAPPELDEDFPAKSKPVQRRKSFHCTQCKSGKAFSNQNRLDRHVERIHNSLKRVTCEICNVVLKSALFHKRHLMLKHPKTPRIYTCDYDGRTFELKDYLRIHLDRHRKHQMFTCEICQKVYISRHTFRRHLKMVSPHQATTPMTDEFTLPAYWETCLQGMWTHFRHQSQLGIACCLKTHRSSKRALYL